MSQWVYNNCLCVVSKWVCDCGVTVGIIYVFVWFQSGYVIVVSQWVCDCGATVGM